MTAPSFVKVAILLSWAFNPKAEQDKLLLVSGFEPDPTSIVSPSSFVALPLVAFLRQAAILKGVRNVSLVIAPISVA